MSKARAAKAKGRGGQNEVVQILLSHFQTLDPDDIKSTTMGDTGEDIQLSPAARKLIPLTIEVKRRKTGLSSLYEWWSQSKNHQRDREIPVVFCRQDYKSNWLVVLDLEDFIRIIRDEY